MCADTDLISGRRALKDYFREFSIAIKLTQRDLQYKSSKFE